jgi:hypothetical protein
VNALSELRHALASIASAREELSVEQRRWIDLKFEDVTETIWIDRLDDGAELFVEIACEPTDDRRLSAYLHVELAPRESSVDAAILEYEGEQSTTLWSSPPGRVTTVLELEQSLKNVTTEMVNRLHSIA